MYGGTHKLGRSKQTTASTDVHRVRLLVRLNTMQRIRLLNSMPTVDGSMTMKSKSLIWPLLLGISGLVLIYLSRKDEDDRVCSAVPAAEIAANPNLKRSLEIEKAKNKCIRERICRPDVLMGSSPCEFTAYDLQECKDMDIGLGDYKTARRHLEAQVETCELDKAENSRDVTVYQWNGEQ